jgi:hypothetical protein
MLAEDATDQPTPDSAAPVQIRSLTASTATPISVVSKPAASSAMTTRRLSAFQIGEAGIIRVDAGTSDFRIADVTPGTGWTVVSYTPGATAGEARVVLSSGSVEVTFIAELVGGNIVTRVESRALTSDGGSGSGSGDVHDDDDDDMGEDDDEHEEEHDDEDHDDEHEEHEDDD